MCAITKMILSGLETKAYDSAVARTGGIVEQQMKCGLVQCSANAVHMRGHAMQRTCRFTYMLDGKRISKAELLKLI